MIILMQGEGSTDLGSQEWDARSNKMENRFGPIGAILKVYVEKTIQSQNTEYCFIDKKTLKTGGKKGSMVLPGKRREKGDAYFTGQARALGNLARERQKKAQNERVAAVLFRDTDPANSNKKTIWKEKFDSIQHGFKSAGFDRGVPMVPKPTSEAWLLALFEPPHTNCAKLEDKKGGDPLKKLLDENLRDRDIKSNNFPYQIMEKHKSLALDNLESMPSFTAFKEFLEKACGGHHSSFNN